MIIPLIMKGKPIKVNMDMRCSDAETCGNKECSRFWLHDCKVNPDWEYQKTCPYHKVNSTISCVRLQDQELLLVIQKEEQMGRTIK